jgi:hypothetical protein
MDLRESREMSREEFAGLWGVHYATERRLELGELPFKRHHLDALVASGLIVKGDQWYSDLEQAMINEAARHRGDEVQPDPPEGRGIWSG